MGIKNIKQSKSYGSGSSDADGRFITEEFLVYVTSSVYRDGILDKLKTIFINIQTEEFDVEKERLYLVCKFIVLVNWKRNLQNLYKSHKSSAVGGMSSRSFAFN